MYTFNSFFHLGIIQGTRTSRKRLKIILDIIYSYLISDFRRNFTSVSPLNMTADLTFCVTLSQFNFILNMIILFAFNYE